MRLLLTAILLALPSSSLHAQSLSGAVRAVDGDTLVMTGTRIRLFGIDAPEAAQTCDRDGEVWACGSDAGAVLSSLVAGKQVTCIGRERDDYGRVVASCTVGRIDLAAEMVGSGYAVAYINYSDAYLPAETRARSLGLGIWGSRFDMPADWRLAHGETPPPRPAAIEPSDDPGAWAGARPVAVYYRNCDAARAAGAAPLRRGDAGYRAEMDGDNDGVACEPYRGRR